MTDYTKQTWVDLNVAYAVSAARMTHIEDGIYDASTRATALEVGAYSSDRTQYVSIGGSDSNDGLTPRTAKRNIQTAINALAGSSPDIGGEVRVAAGTFIGDLVLKSGVSIIGVGNDTIIKPSFSSGAAGAIMMDVGPIINIRLANFALTGNGNTGQHGMYFKSQGQVATPFHGGLWWSEWSNITVRDFTGEQIWLRGGGADGLTPNQSIQMYAVKAYAQNNRRALRMTGQNGQINLYGCTFDGLGKGIGTQNVRLTRQVDDSDAVIADAFPYSINFYGCTVQTAEEGFYIERAGTVAIVDGHFEEMDKGITVYTSTYQARVTGCIFQNVGGDGSGTGYGVLSGSGSKVVVDTCKFIGTYDLAAKEDGGTLIVTNVDATVTGLTKQLIAAATIDTGLGNTFIVNASTTDITTIDSDLNAGSQVFLKAHGGTIQFATGGNLVLGALTSPVVVPQNAIATFVRFDLTGPWFLVTVT